MKCIITGNASAQLYYIVVLIELTIITPWLWKCIENKKRWILFVSPAYLIVCNIAHLILGYSMQYEGKNLLGWVSFYYFGMYAKAMAPQIGKWLNIKMTVLLGCISFFEGLYILNKFKDYEFGISQLKIFSWLLSFSVICLIFSLHGKIKACKRLVLIGNKSYFIFYIHTFVIRCLTILLRRAELLRDIPRQMLTCVGAVLLSYAVCVIIKRIDRFNKISWIVGC